MGQELRRFDPVDRVFDELAEFSPLFVGDRGPEVLDFHQTLADENNLSDVRNAGNPLVTDELRIEG